VATEVIVFPDVEDGIRVFLAAAFAARTGYTTVKASCGTKPATLPAEFVHITRTGGPAELILDRAQITLEAYAKTGARAVAIVNLARGLLHAASREGAMGALTVYSVADFGGPYSDPDPNAPTFTRYSATLQVTVRGSAV